MLPSSKALPSLENQIVAQQVAKQYNLITGPAEEKAARQQWLAELKTAGIAWPPRLWQRVQLRYTDVRGTVVAVTGITWFVVLDASPMVVELREHDLSPVRDDVAPGWVPYKVWVNYVVPPAARALNYDMKLATGSWAFECFPKPQVTGDYQFQEITKPYRRYWHHEVVAVRPSEH